MYWTLALDGAQQRWNNGLMDRTKVVKQEGESAHEEDNPERGEEVLQAEADIARIQLEVNAATSNWAQVEALEIGWKQEKKRENDRVKIRKDAAKQAQISSMNAFRRAEEQLKEVQERAAGVSVFKQEPTDDE